jgi:hypothetical protein
VLGGTPTNSVRPLLKVPNDEQPTAKQTSVTLRSPRRSSRTATRRRRAGTRGRGARPSGRDAAEIANDDFEGGPTLTIDRLVEEGDGVVATGGGIVTKKGGSWLN